MGSRLGVCSLLMANSDNNLWPLSRSLHLKTCVPVIFFKREVTDITNIGVSFDSVQTEYKKILNFAIDSSRKVWTTRIYYKKLIIRSYSGSLKISTKLHRLQHKRRLKKRRTRKRYSETNTRDAGENGLRYVYAIELSEVGKIEKWDDKNIITDGFCKIKFFKRWTSLIQEKISFNE